MKKKLPKFKTDEEAEAFVDEADLSQYDLSDMNPISFEFQLKEKSITMCLPEMLFDAIKILVYLPYLRFIRQTLEKRWIMGSKRLFPSGTGHVSLPALENQMARRNTFHVVGGNPNVAYGASLIHPKH